MFRYWKCGKANVAWPKELFFLLQWCCCYCSWLFEKRQKTLVSVSTLIFCVTMRKLLGGTEEKSIFPTICPPGKSMIFLRKNWVSGQTWIWAVGWSTGSVQTQVDSGWSSAPFQPSSSSLQSVLRHTGQSFCRRHTSTMFQEETQGMLTHNF